MAKGRRAASAVGAYLEALDDNKPRRRRELSVDQLDAHLAEAREAVKTETGVRKLAAAQHVVDLERRIVESTAPQVDISALEDAFVEWAPIYAASKGISYAAFRAAGVPAAALKRAARSAIRT